MKKQNAEGPFADDRPNKRGRKAAMSDPEPQVNREFDHPYVEHPMRFRGPTCQVPSTRPYMAYADNTPLADGLDLVKEKIRREAPRSKTDHSKPADSLLPEPIRLPEHSVGFNPYEQWRAEHYRDSLEKNCSKPRDPDIIVELVNGQPHRAALALAHHHRQQPPQTFGDPMLPESRDPVQNLHEQLPEPAPRKWSPDVSVDDVFEGIVRDTVDTASALAARARIAIGFVPDEKALQMLQELTRTARSIQRLRKEITPHRRGGGRPKKRSSLSRRATQIIRVQIESAAQQKIKNVSPMQVVNEMDSISEDS